MSIRLILTKQVQALAWGKLRSSSFDNRRFALGQATVRPTIQGQAGRQPFVFSTRTWTGFSTRVPEPRARCSREPSVERPVAEHHLHQARQVVQGGHFVPEGTGGRAIGGGVGQHAAGQRAGQYQAPAAFDPLARVEATPGPRWPWLRPCRFARRVARPGARLFFGPFPAAHLPAVLARRQAPWASPLANDQ